MFGGCSRDDDALGSAGMADAGHICVVLFPGWVADYLAGERDGGAMADDGQIEEPITINIGNLCKGKIIDAFDVELQKCLDNIYDLGTPATTTRTITLRVKLKPDDARIKIASEFSCDSSLAQPFPVTDVFFVGKDGETGKLYGLMSDPRQASIIFTPPNRKEAPKPIEFKSAGKQ
jgi:hypothetical protein